MLINDLIMIDHFLITNYFHFSQNKNGLPLQDLMKWKKKYLNQKKDINYLPINVFSPAYLI